MSKMTILKFIQSFWVYRLCKIQKHLKIKVKLFGDIGKKSFVSSSGTSKVTKMIFSY